MHVPIETRKIADIATWMNASEDIPAKNFPEVLQGIFFMDGNPLPDDCLTLQNRHWDDKNLQLTVPVAAPHQWTFHRSIFGWLLLVGAWLPRFRYTIEFEDSGLIQAQITPYFFGIPIPKWIVNPTMCQDAESSGGDTWQRKNLWLGGIPYIGEYVMRRVVTAKGTQTPAFEKMLSRIGSECFIVTQ